MDIVQHKNNLAKSQLELKLQCDSSGKTQIFHQYTTHPLRVSHPFRLDSNNPNRVYLYIRNNSPGLLAGDELNLSLELTQGSQVYLTEQAATKAHPILNHTVAAKVNYKIIMQANTSLEFVCEPLILYANTALRQDTAIQIDPISNLFWTEIILPGRLARGEFYQFYYYDNSYQLTSPEGKLLLRDRSYLAGKNNQFSNSSLFASYPIIGKAIAIYPQINCDLLQKVIDQENANNSDNFAVATSILPYDQGVIIRVLSDKTETIKNYFRSVLNSIRLMNSDSVLPYIPK